MLVSDDVIFTQTALEAFLAGPARARALTQSLADPELEPVADAVTILAKEPLQEQERQSPRAAPRKRRQGRARD